MSRSAFERIPLSAAEQHAYLDRELGQLRAWIAEAKKGEGLSVKRLEAALLRTEERLRAKLDSAKDPGITFEETGVDYLGIDFTACLRRVGDVVPRRSGCRGVRSERCVGDSVLV